jgi:hypothetical protein
MRDDWFGWFSLPLNTGHGGGLDLRPLHRHTDYVVALDHWRAHTHVILEDMPFAEKQAIGAHIDLHHGRPHTEV